MTSAFEKYQRGSVDPADVGVDAVHEDITSQRRPFTDRARQLVYEYIAPRLEKTDAFVLSDDDIYVVWFTKTLQNWKALISTSLPDGMYYEVTYNGDKRETYLDAYKKFDNVCVPD